MSQPSDSLVNALLTGNRRALARTISLVEDGGPEAHALLAALYPHTGRSHVIGITGAPGTGKSTLVNALAKAYREQARTVGIIAVDPTSPFSGGLCSAIGFECGIWRAIQASSSAAWRRAAAWADWRAPPRT